MFSVTPITSQKRPKPLLVVLTDSDNKTNVRVKTLLKCVVRNFCFDESSGSGFYFWNISFKTVAVKF